MSLTTYHFNLAQRQRNRDLEVGCRIPLESNMFVPQWNNRKRERDQADDGSVSGFSEHRMVRLPLGMPIKLQD